MRKVFDEYGGTIIVVIAVVALIGLVAFLMQPGGTMDKAFNSLVHSFTAKSESLADVPPSVEALQERHSFEYYSSLGLAVTDVNNGTIGDNADTEKQDAVAGVYTDEGKTYVVLLKDATEAATVNPAIDMTINLGGHTLSATDKRVIYVTSGNVTIDGRLSGSTVQNDYDGISTIQCIEAAGTSNVTIQNGTYISYTNVDNITSRSIYANETSNLTVSDATIFATSINKRADGIAINTNAVAAVSNCTIVATDNAEGNAYGAMAIGSVTISNCSITTTANGQTYAIDTRKDSIISDCDITAISSNGNVLGIRNSATGTSTISNCSINNYSNYSSDHASVALQNYGTMSLNDCSVVGIHSGVSNKGTLYVNGGTYEGYGHGGFYFAGTGTTSYVQNATIRECAMPSGYTDYGPGFNGAGFYIGGDAGMDNIIVYMDNCDIYGSRHPFALRGTSNEQNNSLYISNSRINKNYSMMGVRIDNDTHRLYIGQNCNFDISDCASWNSLPQFDMSTAVFETDEVYVMSE